MIVLEVKVKMKKLPTCLIARKSSEENGGSKEYLAKGLLKCVKFEQNHISKIKALRKENIVLKFENEILQNLVKNYISKSMTLRKRKLFYKTHLIILTNLS